MENRVTDINTHCHLGLDLQSNCKWGDYVSNIYKKACDRLKILRMLKYQVDRVLNILREGLDFVEAGRPFQSRNVQGMKLLLYETVLQKGSLKLSPDICC
jgi:hypothetical protein